MVLDNIAEYPCPCCGFLTFDEPPGSYSICAICSWEDDISQLRFPTEGGGANKASLVRAQQEFIRINAPRDTSRIRQARMPHDVRRDSTWRPVDLNTDCPETPVAGKDYGDSYPLDRTALYYWRPTYWRRGSQ